MRLSTDAALEAMAPVAEQVGLDITETAAGIFAVANAHMADLLTRQIVSRGYDPRDFVILAYGGAGPMHCAFYGMDSGAREVIVPARAAAFSAFGVGTAPLLHSARGATFAEMPCDADWFNEELRALDERVTAALVNDGLDESQREVVYAVELRFGRQVHTLRLPIPRRTYDKAGIDGIASLFASEYERLYGTGSSYPQAGTFLTGFVVDGYGHLPVPASARLGDTADSTPESALSGRREAYFDGAFVETDVYDYDALRAGQVVSAPAIVEARETTVVVPPGCAARIDEDRNMRISWSLAPAGSSEGWRADDERSG
jgi:N-methylhydantoinase A